MSKKILGTTLLAVPFIVIFYIQIKTMGIMYWLVGFVITALMVVAIFVGVILLLAEGDKQ